MSSGELRVNAGRLRTDIDALAQIGRQENHGIYRMAFSDADMAGRDWLRQRIADSELEFYQDGAANLHARLNWDGNVPSVIAGSHMDTVPGAGHLDGALGVVCALEALRVLKESGVALQRPLEAVSFSDEEGRFGGLFGSQSVAGLVTPEYLHAACDLDGISLTEAMAQQGLDARDALHAQRNPDSIHAYVELHIEQGPVMTARNLPTAIVTGIRGAIRHRKMTCRGKAGHSGAVPRWLRQDALFATAELISNRRSVNASPSSRWASAPMRSASSRRRLELELLGEPTTSTRSQSCARPFTASCRFWVA